MTRNPNLDGDNTAKSRMAALEARRRQVDGRAANVAPVIEGVRAAGATSLRAAELNRRGIPTATGEGGWQADQARRVLARLQA